MIRASEQTVLLPLAGLLLALLMVVSLLGVQGAVDRALNFELSPGSGLTAPRNPALVGPAVIARQPVQRAANAAAQGSSPGPRGALPTGSPADTAISMETFAASPAFEDSSTATVAMPKPSKILIPEETLKMSLFKTKKVRGSQGKSANSVSGKADRVQLFQSTTAPPPHVKPSKFSKPPR